MRLILDNSREVDNPGDGLGVIYRIGSISDLTKLHIPNSCVSGQTWKQAGKLW